MNKFFKCLAVLALSGILSLGISSNAKSAGIDLSHKGNNYGILSQISLQTGEIYTGTMFIVDSGNTLGSDNSSSGDFNRPYSTLDYAIGRCTASNGDLILLLPGHAENLSTADNIDIDVAGVTIIGLGNGSDKPTFTYTAAAGEITVGADNVTIKGIRCNASVTDVLKGINIEAGADYTKIIDCEFGVDTIGTDEFIAVIDFEDGHTSPVVEQCFIDMGTSSASAAGVRFSGGHTEAVIRNCVIRGDYAAANISGTHTTLGERLLIENNLLENGIGDNLNGQPCVELLAATTGTIRNNTISCAVASRIASLATNGCAWFENYYVGSVGTATGTVIGGGS